jgi:hypothetical protein
MNGGFEVDISACFTASLGRLLPVKFLSGAAAEQI